GTDVGRHGGDGISDRPIPLPRPARREVKEAARAGIPALSPLAHLQEPHDEPDRDDHDGAEEEVAEDPLDTAEAHPVDAPDEVPEAVDDVVGRNAEGMEHQPDEERHDDELNDDAPLQAA